MAIGESELLSRAGDLGLSSHLNFIRRVLRPAVTILRDERPLEVGQSRFGGIPDLPAGATWPTHDDGPYRFLGQLNFTELPENRGFLPKTGLLSLFVADDPSGESEYFWGDAGYISAVWLPDSSTVEPIRSPFSDQEQPGTALSFRSTLDIPYDAEQVDDWPFDEAGSDAFRALRTSLHASDDYLLGYPSHCSLAYDPTPPGSLPFLTLGSDESLDWCWHDGDKLMVFIDSDRLRAKDFSELLADAG